MYLTNTYVPETVAKTNIYMYTGTEHPLPAIAVFQRYAGIRWWQAQSRAQKEEDRSRNQEAKIWEKDSPSEPKHATE